MHSYPHGLVIAYGLLISLGLLTIYVNVLLADLYHKVLDGTVATQRLERLMLSLTSARWKRNLWCIPPGGFVLFLTLMGAGLYLIIKKK